MGSRHFQGMGLIGLEMPRPSVALAFSLITRSERGIPRLISAAPATPPPLKATPGFGRSARPSVPSSGIDKVRT